MQMHGHVDGLFLGIEPVENAGNHWRAAVSDRFGTIYLEVRGPLSIVLAAIQATFEAA